MIRKILAVIAGYTIFVITSLALFKLSGHAPHADPGTGFFILTTIYGITCSFIAGLIVQVIARAKDLKPNYVHAVIIAGFAAFSLLKSDGNHWTQILAIAVFAPVSVLGGWYFNK